MTIETHKNINDFKAVLHFRGNGIIIEISAVGKTRPLAKRKVLNKIKDTIEQLKEL